MTEPEYPPCDVCGEEIHPNVPCEYVSDLGAAELARRRGLKPKPAWVVGKPTLPAANHTPGPWLWRDKDSSVRVPGGNGYPYGPSVLRIVEGDDGCAQISDADLALVLAAPDLLAAAEQVLREWTGTGVCDCGVLADAIAKARGQP